MNFLNKILQDSITGVCPKTIVTNKSKLPWKSDLEKLKIKKKKITDLIKV